MEFNAKANLAAGGEVGKFLRKIVRSDDLEFFKPMQAEGNYTATLFICSKGIQNFLNVGQITQYVRFAEALNKILVNKDINPLYEDTIFEVKKGKDKLSFTLNKEKVSINGYEVGFHFTLKINRNVVTHPKQTPVELAAPLQVEIDQEQKRHDEALRNIFKSINSLGQLYVLSKGDKDKKLTPYISDQLKLIYPPNVERGIPTDATANFHPKGIYLEIRWRRKAGAVGTSEGRIPLGEIKEFEKSIGFTSIVAPTQWGDKIEQNTEKPLSPS
jgi:hypothetical protein